MRGGRRFQPSTVHSVPCIRAQSYNQAFGLKCITGFKTISNICCQQKMKTVDWSIFPNESELYLALVGILDGYMNPIVSWSETRNNHLLFLGQG